VEGARPDGGGAGGVLLLLLLLMLLYLLLIPPPCRRSRTTPPSARARPSPSRRATSPSQVWMLLLLLLMLKTRVLPVSWSCCRPLLLTALVLAFAGSRVDSRATHMFISLAPSRTLGTQPWETPVAEVMAGLEETVEKWYACSSSSAQLISCSADSVLVQVHGVWRHERIRRKSPGRQRDTQVRQHSPTRLLFHCCPCCSVAAPAAAAEPRPLLLLAIGCGRRRY